MSAVGLTDFLCLFPCSSLCLSRILLIHLSPSLLGTDFASRYQSIMSGDEIQGFAIRRNGSCLPDETSGPGTWGSWRACCPQGSFCPGNEVDYYNDVCCPDVSNCTALIFHPPVCADSSWSLYEYDSTGRPYGYFCCERDDMGFYVDGENYIGCQEPEAWGRSEFIALTALTTGQYALRKGKVC